MRKTKITATTMLRHLTNFRQNTLVHTRICTHYSLLVVFLDCSHTHTKDTNDRTNVRSEEKRSKVKKRHEKRESENKIERRMKRHYRHFIWHELQMLTHYVSFERHVKCIDRNNNNIANHTSKKQKSRAIFGIASHVYSTPRFFSSSSSLSIFFANAHTHTLFVVLVLLISAKNHLK